MPRLSIVIVTNNSASFIHECLQSIIDQQTPFPVEVVVIDNASTDGTVTLIERQFPQIQLIKNSENRGFNVANNQGIKRSAGDLVLLLNPDTRLEHHALEEMVKFMEHHNDVAAIGPKILNGDGTLQRTGVSFPSLWNTFSESLFLDELFPRSRVFGRHRRLYENPDTEYEVDYVQGSCLLVRREPLEKAGLLDEEYFLYFDETDLCYKLKRQGWNIVYVPRAVVTHYGAGGATFYDEVRLIRFYQSYILFLKKHYSAARQFMFRILLIWRAIVRISVFFFAGIVSRERRSEFKERGHAYRKAALLLLKFE
jgi:GT2 family glycosyltransferase